MKRLYACLLSVLMLFSAAFAELITDDKLLSIAEMLAENVDIAADSEALHALMSTPDAISTIIAAWSEGDHSKATSVYRVKLDEAILSVFVEIDSLPPLVTSSLMGRACMALISSMSAAYGSQQLAACNITTITAAFQGSAGCSIYILGYEEGADVAVCFYPLGDGVIGANATFIPGDFEQNHLADWTESGTPVECLR